MKGKIKRLNKWEREISEWKNKEMNKQINK